MGKRVKSELWSFDTEDDSKGTPFLFNFYDVKRHEHHTFTDQVEAMDFACGLRHARIWAVNLEYDMQNLFRGHLGMLDHCFAGSTLIYSELADDRIMFLNTMNHWSFSVKKMGERIGMSKLEMEHGKKYSKEELDRAIHGSNVELTNAVKMVEYCRRDTEITGKFVAAMTEKYEQIGAVLKTTIASTSLDFFERHYFGKTKHPFKEEQIDFFHTGYYGGRAEIFHTKPVEGKIWYHDKNSLYAAAQKSASFPVLDQFYDTDDKWFEPDFENEGMAEITVRAPEGLNVPYLPCRPDGKLVFPVGQWRATYTYFEIREAKKLGYRVLNVHRAVEFPQSFNPFGRFVDDMYALRSQAMEAKDDLLSEGYKSILTHGYGKFAQKNVSINLHPLKGMRPCNCRLKKDQVCLRKEHLKGGDELFGNDLVFRKAKGKYPRHAPCIWACYVTAHGRHLLYPALAEVEAKGGLLLYCDTDSVVYENKKRLFEDSKKLGDFKLMYPRDEKGEKIDDFWVYAHFKLPKLYCLKSRRDVKTGKQVKFYKAKGVPSKSAAVFFEKGKVRFDRPNKIRETFRRNLNPKRVEKVIPNYWEEREKEIIGKYTKRVVFSDGSTRPLFLKGKMKLIKNIVTRNVGFKTRKGGARVAA